MPTRAEIEAYATQVANRYGVPPSLALAIIETESSFRPEARGKAGEIGLMQLMPPTAAGLGVDPYDWKENIEGGISYLAGLFDKFGNWDMAVAGYNAGPTRVAQGNIPPSTKNYLDKVFSLFNPSTTQTSYVASFESSTFGLSNDFLFLMALAGGSALFLLTRRRS